MRIKRLAAVLSAVIGLLLIFALPAKTNAAVTYVYDETGILTSQQIDEINQLAEEISLRQECGVYVFITSDQHGYSERNYAKGIFMNYDLGYGEGEGASGVLLAIAAEESYFDSVAYGVASDVFTTSKLDQLNDLAFEYLAGGDWYGAAEAFITRCDEMLTAGDYHYYVPTYTDPTIAPNVVQYSPAERRSQFFGRLPFAGIISALVGTISVSVMARKNKNIKIEQTADRYIIKNGVHLSRNQDIFINKTRTVTRVHRDTGGGGGSSGGSHSYHSSGFSSSSGGRHF